MKKTILFSASLAILLGLSGCGGTSSNDNSNLQEGYFVDSPVQGLSFETNSGISGETDRFGKFKFKENDSVKFKIGGVVLGEVIPSKKIVSPEDFKDLTEEQKTLELQFLQSLDFDHNLSNGIKISKEIKESLKDSEIHFVEINNESDLINLSSTLQDYLDSDFDGHIDINETKAKEHFEKTKEEFKNHVPEDFKDKFKEIPEDSNVSSINEDLKRGLVFLWNEEKAAKDLYTYLGDRYNNKTLLNIGLKSETRHEEQVASLLKKYNVNISGEGEFDKDLMNSYAPGEFNVPEISVLYSFLKNRGEASEIDSLKVGCAVEKQDIIDLNKVIMESEKIKAYDVVSVFENLKQASENHLKAFDKALKEKGESKGCSSDFNVETSF